MANLQVKAYFELELENQISKTRKNLEVGHGPSVGNLNEEALERLIRLLLPPSMSIFKGFIIDSYGGQSKEIDRIVFDQAVTPRVVLGSDVSRAPIEACLYAIEVKTKIGSKEVRDSIEKAKSLREIKPLKYTCIDLLSEQPHPILTMVRPRMVLFGWSTDLTKKTEVDRLKDLGNEISGVPMIDIIAVPNVEYSYYDYASSEWITYDSEDGTDPVIKLFAGISNSAFGRLQAPARVDFGQYLFD